MILTNYKFVYLLAQIQVAEKKKNLHRYTTSPTMTRTTNGQRATTTMHLNQTSHNNKGGAWPRLTKF